MHAEAYLAAPDDRLSCLSIGRSIGGGNRAVDRMTRESELPDAVRRRLVDRISLLLQGWERHGRDPNRREAFHGMEALSCLRAGRYDEGEVAVARAVYDVPPLITHWSPR